MRGRLFFRNLITETIGQAKPDFLEDVTKTVHMFFYGTADAQGKSEAFGNVEEIIREHLNNSTDGSAGNAGWEIVKDEKILQTKDEEAFIALQGKVSVN